MAVNQGGTADSFYSSLTEVLFCQGRFFVSETPLTVKRQGSFSRQEVKHDVADETMAKAGGTETQIHIK